MTTINTIEDLIRLLDENPEWAEALRARLLTRQLMELPETFAKFVETTTQALTALRQDVDALKQGQDRLREDVDALKEGQDRLREDVDALKEGQDSLKEGQARLESGMERIRNDIGTLRGEHARTVTLREMGLLAHNLGFTITKVLTSDELVSLTRSSDTTGIPPNELSSFIRADIIAEATDSFDNPCYVAIEASFTINGRDTRRTMRNAEYLARFTGDPAYAVVSGVHIDDRVVGLTQSGEVIWHQLEPRSFGAE
jgi:exonuclease VII small subunit